MALLKVFIGYDQVESVAWHVLNHSIQRLASHPVSVTPIMLSQLEGVYYRPRDPKQSNEFSFSRFLVPYLCDYEGYGIFMDSDMLLRTDIHEIMQDITPDAAVSVVQHDYTPRLQTKFLGATQYRYPRKNWSSVMVFNNERCAKLTPEYVNNASPMDLHQFAWADGVGSLDREWNHLVGEYDPNPGAKIVHFTEGMPLWPEYMDCEYAKEWWDEFDRMRHWDKNVVYTSKVEKP